MLNRNFLVGCGVGGSAEHLHWRIVILATGDSVNYTNLAEIEMRATPGGADQCNGGIATSSPVYSTNTPDRGFDNNTSTAWLPSAIPAAGAYIAYQHIAPVVVRELSLTYTSSLTTWPTQVRLDWSDDGINWTPHATFNTGWTSNINQTVVVGA